ncbi:hypothetical protein SPFL3102_00604 [Sporomusaceae bacterium FL31]|nr:hypothetical protein SPFL3101_01347 [Sporomusaceae bacterium FL31]GCE32807.1 hypothetical protein SPFL3102_00604 [Sporomusaceae bacterium]
MSIVCGKCQALIEETVRFCSHCGFSQESAIIEQVGGSSVEDVLSVSENAAISEIKREYQFEKQNYIGSLRYSIITTHIQLEASYMEIVQDKKTLGIFKKRRLDTKIEYGDIHDIVIKKTMDKYDSVWAIICCVLGIIMPVAFLLAIVLFWAAYGKKIHIFTKKHVYQIPTTGEVNLDELVRAVKVFNPDIFIKGNKDA